MGLQEKTFCVSTPSGGIHIYLLSKEKPAASQPKGNIDYQANTGTGRGKYIVCTFRWKPDGTRKQYYKHIPSTPENILVVENTDIILEDLIKRLTEDGLIITPVQQQQDQLIEILVRNVKEGERQFYSCAIAGALRKVGYQKDKVKEIIKLVFANDPELESRINNVDRTFEKQINNVLGMSWLKDNLPPVEFNELSGLLQGKSSDLKGYIIGALSKNKEPTSKLLADYVNSRLELYTNLETYSYYEKNEKGQYIEIDEIRIIDFCNEEFGYNSISKKRCHEVLKYVTTPIKKNYDIIEFSNGILNTKTQYFTENKEEYNETPKLILPFEWNSEAKPGKIGKVISEILDNPKYPHDKITWLRAVGHAFQGYNRIGKLVIVQGPSGTGKSTLHGILKHIFNYSTVSTRAIVLNERFTLRDLIDKDINIDDDINNGVLKSIGHLNSVTTGEGLSVEVKGENRSIKAGNRQVPRLFAAGNSLPPVLGEGFERRLLLIHAATKVKYENRDDNLINDIIEGRYDQDGIEWLVYTAINEYWKIEGKAITTEEQEAAMLEEFEFKSWPLINAVNECFEFDMNGFLQLPEIMQVLKLWVRDAYKQGRIGKEHIKVKGKNVKAALDNEGYVIDSKRIDDGSDYGSTRRVYVDIKIRDAIALKYNIGDKEKLRNIKKKIEESEKTALV